MSKRDSGKKRGEMKRGSRREWMVCGGRERKTRGGGEVPALCPRLGNNDANELDQHEVWVPQIKIFSGKRPRLLHCKKRHFQRELVSATVRFLCLVSANTVGTLCKYVSVFMFSEATGLARGSCRPRGFFSSSYWGGGSPWQFRPLVGSLTSTLMTPQEIQCLCFGTNPDLDDSEPPRHSLKQWLYFSSVIGPTLLCSSWKVLIA